jgi:hypothetical protein
MFGETGCRVQLNMALDESELEEGSNQMRGTELGQCAKTDGARVRLAEEIVL